MNIANLKSVPVAVCACGAGIASMIMSWGGGWKYSRFRSESEYRAIGSDPASGRRRIFDRGNFLQAIMLQEIFHGFFVS